MGEYIKDIFRVLAIIAGALLYVVLFYSSFTGTPIESIIKWEWWVLFLVLDIWFEIKVENFNKRNNDDN